MRTKLDERDTAIISRVLQNGFRRSQPAVCAFGFPITFRKLTVEGHGDFWVPKGFSRAGNLAAWRFNRRHKAGQVTAYCSDGERDPEASLKDLWVRATKKLDGLTCPTTSLVTLPGSGRPRHPLLDTGITGVSIQRRRCPLSNDLSIFIAVLQRLARPDGGNRTHYECIKNFTHAAVLRDRQTAEQEFREAVVKAAMVRFEYNHQIVTKRRPETPLSPEDVSDYTRAQRNWIESQIRPISLGPIFASEPAR